MTDTELRHQILTEAMSGTLGPTPFVPSEAFLVREVARRRTALQSSAGAQDLLRPPVRTDLTSDATALARTLDTIQRRRETIRTTLDTIERALDEIEHSARAEVGDAQRRADRLSDDTDDVVAWGAGSDTWTPSIGDRFRDLRRVDQRRSTVMVDPQRGAVTLPTLTSQAQTPAWTEADLGSVVITDGQSRVARQSLTPGSRLRNLITGAPGVWSLELDVTEPGPIALDLIFSLPTPAALTRIELTATTPGPLSCAVQTSPSTWIDLGQATPAGIRSFWSTPEIAVRALRFHVAWQAREAGLARLTLDDLGLFRDIYGERAEFVTTSLPADTVLSRARLSVVETQPPGTSIRYWIGLDPLASGAFLGADGNIVPAGPAALSFDQDASGSVLTSVLRTFSTLPGASGYADWEPVWHAVSPVTRTEVSADPATVSFEHLVHRGFVSGLADAGFSYTEYESETAGWWRPYVKRDEQIPAASTAFPDVTVNGIDFYRIYYWPPASPVIPDSVILDAGTQTQDGRVVGSGALWTTAQQTSPGLVDVTDTNLEPDASGTILITASGSVLFDTVRNVRHTGSWDTPFIRGDDYRVYGSGNLIELDISEIQSTESGFSTQERPYEVTYTIAQSEGVVASYLFSTVVRVAPGTTASVHITNTSQLRRVQLAHLGSDREPDTVERIEYPHRFTELVRPLEPGYTRLLLVANLESYRPADFVSFEGSDGVVPTLEVPFHMRRVPSDELFYHTPRHDHGSFALVPGASGAQWLVVNDPGSEGFRHRDDVLTGTQYRSDDTGTYLFHDSASGILKYYTLSYDEAITPETHLMLKAELTSQSTDTTPILAGYRIDIGARFDE